MSFTKPCTERKSNDHENVRQETAVLETVEEMKKGINRNPSQPRGNPTRISLKLALGKLNGKVNTIL